MASVANIAIFLLDLETIQTLSFSCLTVRPQAYSMSDRHIRMRRQT